MNDPLLSATENAAIALDIVGDYAESFISHWIDDDDPEDHAAAEVAQGQYEQALAVLRAALAQREALADALRLAIQQEENNTCGDGEEMPWIHQARVALAQVPK